jgi:sporulation protein YlmC with PRC-barrel domain
MMLPISLQSKRRGMKVAMAAEVQYTIGARAICTDGRCGQVTRVVVDPIARVVTDLVVEPAERHGLGRLVPLDLVEAGPDEVRLRCTTAEFERLQSAEETEFLPGTSGYAAYGPEQVLARPYFGLGGTRVSGDAFPGTSGTVTFDVLPPGEVAIRRNAPVHATDGDIGQVEGLVIDPRSRRLTHVLLKRGHLWGRRDVAVPIAAVQVVDEDGLSLSLTKQEVEDLPPVDIDRPGG